MVVRLYFIILYTGSCDDKRDKIAEHARNGYCYTIWHRIITITYITHINKIKDLPLTLE